MRRLHLSAEQPFWLPALVEASKIGWWTHLQALFDCVNRYTELYTKAKQWEYHEGLEQIRPLAPRIFVQFHEHSRVYSAARLAVAELSPALWAQLPCEDDVLVGHMTPLEAAQAVRRVLAALVDTRKPTAQQPTPADNSTAKRRRGRSVEEVSAAVQTYLLQNKHRRQEVTVREIAEFIRASPATVTRTPSWKAFEERRKQERPSKPRTVLLTDRMLQAVPDPKSRSPEEEAELQALIAEQQADLEADERPRRRRV